MMSANNKSTGKDQLVKEYEQLVRESQLVRKQLLQLEQLKTLNESQLLQAPAPSP